MKLRYIYIVVTCMIIFISLFSVVGFAKGDPPPLPLHGIEGMGGICTTYSAYLVNPAEEGTIFGMPSVGAVHVNVGKGRHLDGITITETLWDRIELGYGWNHLDIGDLPRDVFVATGLAIGDHSVSMHNFNLRVLAVKEGGYNQSWLPAVTFGIHYKHNSTTDNIDQDLLGTLKGIGIENNDGWDFTVYGSKMITGLPRPLLINLGLRSTEAAHLGLLGFTEDRKIGFEGNLVVFLTGQFAVAAEYRQKPNEYTELPGLIEEEEDWWALCAAYVVNNNMTISGGYGHFGDVLNHQANKALGAKIKWEF